MGKAGKPRRIDHHACSQCDAVFGHSGHLTRHVRAAHEQRRDHACSQCDSTFGQAGDLRVHVRAVHEQRRDHTCPQCDAAFGVASSLRRHVRTVHEQRRDHACIHCLATLSTAQSLAKHLAYGKGHKCAGMARRQQIATRDEAKAKREEMKAKRRDPEPTTIPQMSPILDKKVRALAKIRAIIRTLPEEEREPPSMEALHAEAEALQTESVALMTLPMHNAAKAAAKAAYKTARLIAIAVAKVEGRDDAELARTFNARHLTRKQLLKVRCALPPPPPLCIPSPHTHSPFPRASPAVLALQQ